MDNDKKIILYRLLDELSEREKKIIILYYGLEGEPRTLESVGKDFDVTRERIRQIRQKAFQKIKRIMYRKGITFNEEDPKRPIRPKWKQPILYSLII